MFIRVNLWLKLLAWASAGKPFGVLIALSSEICDPFPAQEGEVTLDARRHRAAGEVPELLPVPLAVEDVRPERREVEVRRHVGESVSASAKAKEAVPISERPREA